MSTESQEKSASWRLLGERTRRQLEELDALLERMLALPPFDLPETQEQVADSPSSNPPIEPQRHPEASVSSFRSAKPPSSGASRTPGADSAERGKVVTPAANLVQRDAATPTQEKPADAVAQNAPGSVTSPPVSKFTATAELSPSPVETQSATTAQAAQRKEAAQVGETGGTVKATDSQTVSVHEIRQGESEQAQGVSGGAGLPGDSSASAGQTAPASGRATETGQSPASRQLSRSSTSPTASKRGPVAEEITATTSPNAATLTNEQAGSSQSLPRASAEVLKGPAWLLREDSTTGESDAAEKTHSAEKRGSDSGGESKSAEGSPQQLRWLKPVTNCLTQAFHWLFMTPTGSNLLGLIGILLLLGSAAFWLGAWLGWHW